MKEKKLTDKEIVKGLKNWILHDCTAKQEDLVNALDLIHRLQSENAELKEDNESWKNIFHIGEERKYRKMFNEEWKKEYQKELDKQGKGLIAGSPDFDYVYKRYFEQKAEIERLTEKYENMHGEIILLNHEKLEYKKQVDELSHENDELEYRAEELERKIGQAVKDKAKEIYQEMYAYSKRHNWYCLSPDDIEMFADKHGVEVE